MKKVFLLSSILLFFTNNTSFAEEISVKNNTIYFTQTPCQFVESEYKNGNFKTNTKNDCEKINDRTKTSRKTKSLVLKPGKYTFKVLNKNVPYELGFYLRGTGFGWITHPKISGGGLFKGVTKDYTINLTEGEYVYSCPLNPTLDYSLTVKK
ncbi:MAG: hypothetical protein AABZ74_11525 [Cyanobacteriota bacterium]